MNNLLLEILDYLRTVSVLLRAIEYNEEIKDEKIRKVMLKYAKKGEELFDMLIKYKGEEE